MDYSDFTIPQLKQKFDIAIDEETNLFGDVSVIELPATLTDILRRYLPLALNLNTEKARSEFIIAPLLAEFKLLHRDQLSLFSGIEFNVDEDASKSTIRNAFKKSLNSKRMNKKFLNEFIELVA